MPYNEIITYEDFVKDFQEYSFLMTNKSIEDDIKAFRLERIYEAYGLFISPYTDEFSMFGSKHDIKREVDPYLKARKKIEELFKEELPNDQGAEEALRTLDRAIDRALFWKRKTKEDIRTHFRSRSKEALLTHFNKTQTKDILEIFGELQE